jgi:large subunit ribosomal protein L9
MQIILLEKVVNLGNLGDVVKVKDGYARNFLIPSRQAKRATANAIKEFEARRAELEKAAADKLAASQAVGEKLAGTTIKLTQKAGVDGRLFGSVTNHDIAEELVKAGFAVTKAQVRMPTGPIKLVGESAVSVSLHTDVVVEITVAVLGETA